jgi:hypothetical protein
MSTLAQQRCFHHAHREAVCRCPNCANYYCRECVTEHDDRLICAACLRRLSSPAPRQRALGRAAGLVSAFAGLLLAWLFFYYAGRALILIPSDVHEGTEWQP